MSKSLVPMNVFDAVKRFNCVYFLSSFFFITTITTKEPLHVYHRKSVTFLGRIHNDAVGKGCLEFVEAIEVAFDVTARRFKVAT